MPLGSNFFQNKYAHVLIKPYKSLRNYCLIVFKCVYPLNLFYSSLDEVKKD